MIQILQKRISNSFTYTVIKLEILDLFTFTCGETCFNDFHTFAIDWFDIQR